MKEYFVTIFFNKTIIQEKLTVLSDLCVDGFLPDHLYSQFPIVFPFYKTGDIYIYKALHSFNGEILIKGQPAPNHIISHGDYVTVKNAESTEIYSFLFVDSEKSNLGFKKYNLGKNVNIFIGRLPEMNICYDINSSVSRKHAAIRTEADGGAYIEDLSRKSGIFLNGIRTNSAKLSLYDEIYIMGLTIIYMGNYIAVKNMNVTCKLQEADSFLMKEIVKVKERKVYFVRSPRILKSLDVGIYEIDPPTTPQTSKKIPAMLTMGPTLTMSIAMITGLGFSVTSLSTGGSVQSVATSGAMAFSMMLGAILWPTLLNNYQRRQEAADEKYRREKYVQYISKKDKDLEAKYKRNTRIWNDVLSPEPSMLSSLVDDDHRKLRLWERSYSDKDFLHVRIGRGERSLGIDIQLPKDGFTLDHDELMELPKEIAQKYSVLKDVPIMLPLKEQATVGVIGNHTNIFSIAKGIALNITALHSYDEVKIVFICGKEEAGDFSWMKELPHIWSPDHNIRYVAENAGEAHQVFNAIDDIVKERELDREDRKKGIQIPHFVFFITDPALIENEPLLRYIENPNNQVGISSLFLYGDIAKLPKDCSVIIQSDDSVCGYYSKNRNDNKFIPFQIDVVDGAKLNDFGKKLSNLPVRVDSRNLTVPDKVTFLQMYKTGNVAGLDIERRWGSNASNKTLAALIGVKAGGESFSLDIHEAYHGCHGLVAGMTGSGKSEFLQEYVLSLAVNYSPNEVAFVLVDFKGGDMARPFMSKEQTENTPYVPPLPHLAAIISNLSGNILYRALVSFDAEIKTRQKLFNASAAALGIDKIDINTYHKYFKEGRLKTPLPHLIIIIDEFAQLKTQHPDFLAQLINVAQVGRSLGIHLILATQKPSGMVDPQIWSNSRFHVCLKVLDKQDSAEMINRPDAAMIKQPGRCFVQVGYDEVFECLQSGYSGADYIPSNFFLNDDEITVHMVDNTATPLRSAKDVTTGQKSGRTQLEETVKQIIAIGQIKNLRVKPLWCPLLPDEIYLEDLQMEQVPEKRSLSAIIALLDNVKTQTQTVLEINLLQIGHIALYGASGTGKTTFLQTLLYSLATRYTPEDMNLYVLDFGGRSLHYMNLLPHCGDVVFSDNEEQTVYTLDAIQSIIDERKRLFASKNCGSYSEFLNATGEVIPAILFVIDNYAPFRERFYKLEEDVVNIISSGKTYGVFAIITGNSKNAIYYKVTEHISAFFTLKMNDNMNYRDILNVSIPVEPENVKGRGITIIDDDVVEFQTALAVRGENEAERIQKISGQFNAISKEWTGARPGLKVSGNNEKSALTSKERQAVISNPVSGAKAEAPDQIEITPHTLFTGKSLSGAILYGIELSNLQNMFVGGTDNEDIISALKFYVKNIMEQPNRRLTIVDDENELLKECSGDYENSAYINTAKGFTKFLNRLEKACGERSEKLREMKEDPIPDDVIYGNMYSFEREFVIISDFAAFYNMITDKDADKFTEIAKQTAGLGIYIITSSNIDSLPIYNNTELYSYLIKAPVGIICADGIKKEKAGLLCDDMISVAISQPKAPAKGQGIFYIHNRSVMIKREGC